MTFDVFISHASEDKEEFVKPLIHDLQDYSINFWLDEFEIGWGNSIIRRLNEGLSSSKYVLILLTDNFLNKNWTKTELESALSAEITTNKLIVLPIMVTNSETVFSLFPLLRSKLYLNWSEGTQKIASKLSAILDREFKKGWVGNHPAEYFGKVWIKILKLEQNLQVPHNFTIRWAPWLYKGQLPVDENKSVCLVHTKGNDGFSLPILIEIDQPCHVTFGQNEPIDKNAVDVNHGWKKVKGSS
jgi:hypothetical protein